MKLFIDIYEKIITIVLENANGEGVILSQFSSVEIGRLGDFKEQWKKYAILKL